MNGIKEFRLQLGLSQYRLAEYLGIPRSTLSMSEAGQRCLPVHALQMLAVLQQTLDTNDLKSNHRLAAALSPAAPVEIQTALRKRSNELELAYQRERLAKMAYRFQELERKLVATQRILFSIYENSEENRFWEAQKRSILDKMKGCNH